MFGILKRQDINKGIDEFKATSGAILLDVRTKEEYRSGHVPGSKHINVSKIESISALADDKSTPLFVYCLSGARSSRAVDTLINMGYTNVKNIGGINSYRGPAQKGV